MYSKKTPKGAPASSSQLSKRTFATPSSSRWTPINAGGSLNPPNAFKPPGAQWRRSGGAAGGSGSGIAGPPGINSRPSGIEQRPPFSIGPGESRGVICAVCASNSVERSMGLAFVNIPIAEAVLTTVTDTQFYPRTIHKIQMMEASRILMQSTPESAVQSGLALRPHIEEELVGVPIIETAKLDWSAGQGMRDIQRVAFEEDLPCLEFAATDNNHMLSAFSAAMKFLRDEFAFDFDDHSVRIKYQPPADVMMISLPTIRSLELIQNANTLQKLKPLGDVEQLLTKLVILPKDGSVYESEQAINNILKLKAFLTAIPDIKLYEDFSGKIHDYVNELENEIRAKITLKYTAARKFFLQVKAKDFGQHGPPAVLINRTKTKGGIECQTLKLVGYNERINQAVHGAMIESDEVIKGLLSEIRPQVSTLFKYCEAIALLDLLVSFATLTKSFAYTEPDIQGDSYALVGGRHPILDSRGLHKCIPNDYFVTAESRFQIITGQNMSGKSTYIRAIAMLQIMAQIGCHIPAESARLPVLYSLFTRVSTDDTLELNLSTFSIEMREMAFILRNVNNKSLVIVDELGRATSTRDGLAIAAAMSEALLQSNATVFFATHFAELAKGFANNIGVVNRHLQTITEYADGQAGVPVMKMMYRVTEGAETEVSYGIALAKAIGFPATFIAHAEKVAAELRARAQESKRDMKEMEEAKRRKLVANLVRQLRLANESSAGDEELWQYLKQIHDDFWAKMLSSNLDQEFGNLYSGTSATDAIMTDSDEAEQGDVNDDYGDEDMY
ncbi:MutS protein msh4 [Sporothrix curviconia]|uniref:MutS protein msh4 n=1 Tax=Sporothrix curviconia TaxID=1260050 RepID=A0ABP0BJJ3_9PEZI